MPRVHPHDPWGQRTGRRITEAAYEWAVGDAVARLGLREAEVRILFSRLNDVGLLAESWPSPILTGTQDFTPLHSLAALHGVERAWEFLASVDLDELARRVRLTRFLCHPGTPLLSAHGLADAIDACRRHQERARGALLTAGVPAIRRREDLVHVGFVDMRLRCLYFTDWKILVDAAAHPVAVAGCPSCEAGDHDPESMHETQDRRVDGLNDADAARLVQLRERVLAVKIKVLTILDRALRLGQVGKAEECFGVIFETLLQDELEFLLRMDRCYAGVDVITGEQRGNRSGFAGGLTDLLYLIGHVEQEIELGTFSKTRAAIDAYRRDHARQLNWEPFDHYFTVVLTPERAAADELLDVHVSLSERMGKFLSAFGRRVGKLFQDEARVVTEFGDAKAKHAAGYVAHIQWLRAHMAATDRLPTVVSHLGPAPETEVSFPQERKVDEDAAGACAQAGPLSLYGPQRLLAEDEADRAEATADASRHPVAMWAWLHVGEAFRHALELAKMTRHRPGWPPRPSDFVAHQVRLDVLVERIGKRPDAALPPDGWPATPGVTFTWRAADSHLELAVAFATTIHMEVQATLIARVGAFGFPADAQIAPVPDPRLVEWMQAALHGISARDVPPELKMWHLDRDGDVLLRKLRKEFEDACRHLETVAATPPGSQHSNEAGGTTAAPSGPGRDAPESDASAAPALRRTRVGWTLVMGSRSEAVPDLAGFKYIAYLIRHAHEEIPVTRVRKDVNREYPVPLRARGGMQMRSRGADDGDAGGGGVTGSALPVADARALKAVREKLQEIEEAQSQAEAANDPARYDSLESEREQLVAYLSAGEGKDGRPRGERSETERARKSVAKAVTTALDELKDIHPEAHGHFQEFLKIGVDCKYAPDPPISWLIEDASTP